MCTHIYNTHPCAYSSCLNYLLITVRKVLLVCRIFFLTIAGMRLNPTELSPDSFSQLLWTTPLLTMVPFHLWSCHNAFKCPDTFYFWSLDPLLKRLCDWDSHIILLTSRKVSELWFLVTLTGPLEHPVHWFEKKIKKLYNSWDRNL